jgi:hypothetical protein
MVLLAELLSVIKGGLYGIGGLFSIWMEPVASDRGVGQDVDRGVGEEVDECSTEG